MTKHDETPTALPHEPVGPAIIVAPSGTQGDSAAHSDSRRTWTLGRHQWALLLMSYLALVCVGTGIGLLLKGPLDDSVVVRTDRRVAVWFAEHRTPNLNTYTVWGSDLADTFIKIAVTAVLAFVLWLIWRRWLEPLALIVSLALEAAVFITVTTLVQRPRPDVPRLEGSPVNSSFPSGHTVAVAAYSALAVIVFWHTRNRWARVTVVSLCAFVIAAVAFSRMYRGMHFLSDVLAGAVLGLISVVITAAILSSTPQGRAALQNDDGAKDGVP